MRDRPEDTTVLTQHFLDNYNLKYAKKVRISHDGMDLLATYAWPGNVRELQNIVERLVLISDHSTLIDSDCLMPILHPGQTLPSSETRAPSFSLPAQKTLKAIVEDIEREVIAKALSEHGSTRKAAKALGIDQSTIVKKAKRIGIRLADEIIHQ